MYITLEVRSDGSQGFRIGVRVLRLGFRVKIRVVSSSMGGSFQYDGRAPSRVTSIGFTPMEGMPFQRGTLIYV